MLDILDAYHAQGGAMRIAQTPSTKTSVPAAVVSVQRRSGGDYINIAGTAVQPYEVIMFVATGLSFYGKAILFTLKDSSGAVLDAREIVRNPWDSQLSYETTAPGQVGTYTVTCHETANLFGIPLPSVPDSSVTFSVSTEAPPPPAPKPDTSFLGGAKDVFKWGVIAAVAIGAVVLVKEAAPAARAIKGVIKQ